MSFKPKQISNLDILGFFLLTLGQAMLSLAVHVGTDNLFSLLAHTSTTILFSQVVYSTLTSFQFLKYSLMNALQWGHKRKSDSDNKKNKTVSSILCNASYFGESDTTPAFRLARGELWRLQYLVSMGVFSFFACIPAFDATCTSSMVFGFLIQSSYNEFVRGSRYHRPISRRVLFVVAMLFGFLSCFLTFAFAYSIGVVSTDIGKEKSIGLERETLDDIYSELAVLSDNSTNSEIFLQDRQSESAWMNDTVILDKFFEHSLYSNKLFLQYAKWSSHSYPVKMFPLWLVFLLSPFMISKTPRHMPREAIVEFIQTPVSFIASLVLLMISVVISRQPFLLVQTVNSSGLAFTILSPILTWLCVWKMLEYQKQKTVYLPTCIILVVSFFKHCIQHGRLLRLEIFDNVAIVSGIMLILYIACTVFFVRLETTAIRMGWGSTNGLALNQNELGLSEIGEEDEEEQISFVIEDTVQQVLEDAKRDLQDMEKELKQVDRDDTSNHSNKSSDD